MPDENPSYESLSPSKKATLKLSGLLFAEEKSAIQLLTLTKDAEAIFKLRDDDWTKITGLEIRYRAYVEESMRNHWDEFCTLWNDS